MIDGATVRYRMLETIREYGTEQLADRGEARPRGPRTPDYFAAVAAEVDPVLRTGRSAGGDRRLLRTERDNILAALRFLAESDDPADRAASLDLALSTDLVLDDDRREQPRPPPGWGWRCPRRRAPTTRGGRGRRRRGRCRRSISGARELPAAESGRDCRPRCAELSGEFETRRRAADRPRCRSCGRCWPIFGGDIDRAEAAMEQILQSPRRLGPGGGQDRAVPVFAENEGDLSRCGRHRRRLRRFQPDRRPLGARVRAVGAGQRARPGRRHRRGHRRLRTGPAVRERARIDR